MEDFAKRKQRILKGLVHKGAGATPEDLDRKVDVSNSSAVSKPDKSLKGGIDALLVPICELLNSHPDYFTTSCCSGRITAYQQAHTATGKRVKSGGRLVFVSHDPVDLLEADQLLTDILGGSRHYPEKKASKDADREDAPATLMHTDLKLEPVILHVEASTATAALVLLRAAIAAGLRESGISALGRRNLVAIRGSQRMEVPLTLGGASPAISVAGSGQPQGARETHSAAQRGEEVVLVTREYFASLLFLCNEKLKCNERQITRLYEAFRKELGAQGVQASNTEEWEEPEALGQPARDGHCSKPSQLNGLETAGGGPGVCVGSCDSRTLGTRAGVESFIGLHDRKQLKTVKTALESLGLFDKTRKVQQIQLDEHNKFSSEITPQPPSGCTWLALLPVRGPVNAASLPLDMRASLVLNPASEDSLQLFWFSSPPAPRVSRKSVAGCLDALLRAACESTPGGDILLRRAEELQRKESLKGPSVGAAAAPAAGETLVAWPDKFERVGDVLLLPSGSLAGFHRLKHMGWHVVGATPMSLIETRLWRGFCQQYAAKAVGVQAPIAGRMRQSQVKLVFGKSGLTTVRENGVLYTLDVTKCMFASGNGTERLRFRNSLLKSEGPPETVVDLFCGIGYFSLSALAFVPPHRLQKLYACDINPTALRFFMMSLAENHVDPSRVTFLLCDSFSLPSGGIDSDPAAVAANVDASAAAAAAREAISYPGDQQQHGEQQQAPTPARIPAALVGVADRISLGLIPSSEEAWPTAVSLLNDAKGGILHIHGVAPLEAVEGEERPVSNVVYVYPDADSGEATAAETNKCGRNKNTDVGGNCKLGARLRFAQHALSKISALVKEKATRGRGTWEVYIHHVEKVKSYAPRLFHFVVDIIVRPAL